MTLRRTIEQLPDGKKLLASAKLRRQIVRAMNRALITAEMTQSDLARELGKSRSAVNQVLTGDGNLKIETVAEYFCAMGSELEIRVKSSNTAQSLPSVDWAALEEVLKKAISTSHKKYVFRNKQVIYKKNPKPQDVHHANTTDSMGLAA